MKINSICTPLLFCIATLTVLFSLPVFSLPVFSLPVFAMTSLPAPEGFVFIPGGCFEMGDALSEGPHPSYPVHEVCISDFYLGRYEVTVGAFRAFVVETAYQSDAEKDGSCLSWMGTGWRKYEGIVWKRPGFSQTKHHPVVCLSWHDVSAYIIWKREKTGLHFRLPTEAEWEYAARSGGKQIKDERDKTELRQFAWFRDNADKKTHAVGQKKANALGLYDMSGNVWEWVQDAYHDRYYARSPKNNPRGPQNGKGRVMRGGSWYNPPQGIRATHRNWTYAFKCYTSLGFRLALEKSGHLDKTTTVPR